MNVYEEPQGLNLYPVWFWLIVSAVAIVVCAFIEWRAGK